MFNTLHFLGNSNKGLKACLTHNMHSLKCEQVNMSFDERMHILSRSDLFVNFALVWHIIFDERRDRKCFLFESCLKACETKQNFQLRNKVH